MISFLQLHTLPGFSFSEYHYHSVSDPLLDQIKSYVPFQTSGDLHTLYLADSSLFEAYSEKEVLSWAVVISEKQPLPDHRNQNVLFLKSSLSCDQICELLQDCLHKQNIYENARLQLQEAAISGKGLIFLAETASRILGNPLMITDDTFQVIAMSEDHGEQHDYWRRAVETRFCSYDNFIKNKEMLTHALNSRKPILDQTSCSDGSILMGSIGTNQTFLGYTAVYECNRKFTDVDLKIFESFQNILIYQMQLSISQDNSKWQEHEMALLLQDVVQRGDQNPELISTLKDNLHLAKSSYYYIYKIGEAPRYTANIPFFLLIPELERILSNSRCILTRSHLLIIAGRNHNHPFSDVDEETMFDTFLTSHHLCAGISHAYSSLYRITYAREQADKALDYCLNFFVEKSYIHYQETLPFQLIEEASPRIDVFTMCDPRIIRMLEYDAANHTEYLTTFYELIHNQCDTATVMKNIHVHRNTLYYRMQKMETLFDFDWKNMDNYESLLLSSDIMRFLGKGSLSVDEILKNMKKYDSVL